MLIFTGTRKHGLAAIPSEACHGTWQEVKSPRTTEDVPYFQSAIGGMRSAVVTRAAFPASGEWDETEYLPYSVTTVFIPEANRNGAPIRTPQGHCQASPGDLTSR